MRFRRAMMLGLLLAGPLLCLLHCSPWAPHAHPIAPTASAAAWICMLEAPAPGHAPVPLPPPEGLAAVYALVAALAPAVVLLAAVAWLGALIVFAPATLVVPPPLPPPRLAVLACTSR